jgi:hypothetical protein
MIRWPQFSLITLAGVVAFCAIGCAALVYASAVWAASLITGAIVLLMFATTAAVYGQGSRRAFWLGMSIWGWLYLLLSGWLFSGQHQADKWGQSPLPDLATTQLSRWVYAHVLPRLRTPPSTPGPAAGSLVSGIGLGSDSGLTGTMMAGEGMPGTIAGVDIRVPALDVAVAGEGAMTGMSTGSLGPAPGTSFWTTTPTAPSYPDLDTFLRVSQALWLWVFALTGGAVGRWLHAARS